jgi:hypothetical protein
MKKIVKKIVHKPESERSKTERLLRDIAFFGVIVYAAVMTFLVVNAESTQVEAESALLSAQIEAQQVAFTR